jgi:lysozyme
MDELIDLVRQFEGLHRVENGLVYPYLCPAGYPTQGFGLRVKDLDVPPITVLTAEKQVRLALRSYVDQTLKLAPNLSGLKLAATSDFVFNLGATAFSASTFRKRILDEDWEAAATECQRWVFGGGRKLSGLVRRRAAEAAMFSCS